MWSITTSKLQGVHICTLPTHTPAYVLSRACIQVKGPLLHSPHQPNCDSHLFSTTSSAKNQSNHQKHEMTLKSSGEGESSREAWISFSSISLYHIILIPSTRTNTANPNLFHLIYPRTLPEHCHTSQVETTHQYELRDPHIWGLSGDDWFSIPEPLRTSPRCPDEHWGSSKVLKPQLDFIHLSLL